MQQRHETTAQQNDQKHWKLAEVETLTDELRRLLAQNLSFLDEDNIRTEVEVLERWGKHYDHNLVSAEAFSEVSTILLNKLQTRLRQDIDEMERLVGEGGRSAPSKEQAEKNESLSRILARIEKILSRDAKLRQQ